MRTRWIVVGMVVVAMIAGGVAIGLATRPYSFAGVVSETPAPDFSLTDENDHLFKLSDLRGKWILLAYGYTHCPDVCPLTLSILRDVKRSFRAADQLGVVFVTIDPERDTVPILKQYMDHFDASFKGLSGTPEQIAQAAQAYNVKYEKKASAAVEGYAMSHTAFIYLIDPQFRLRLTFPFGIKSGDITSDLHYLIDHAQAD